MKIIYKYIERSALILLSLSLFIACEDTYEQHNEFIEDGEIIYPTKLDSLKSFTGANRVKFTGTIKNAFDVSKVVVTWGGTDAERKEFDYVRGNQEIDSLTLIVDGLDEGVYNFNIFSQDDKNNASLKKLIVERVFGNTFSENLVPRGIKSLGIESNGEALLTFTESGDFTRDTEISYTNTSGEEINLIVVAGENVGTLINLDPSKPINYRTFYVPTVADFEGNETSIDTFPSPWGEASLPSSLQSIVNSVTVTSAFGGALLSWSNPDNLDIEIGLKNTFGGQVLDSGTASSNLSSDSRFYVNMFDAGMQSVEVRIADLLGNYFGATYEVTVDPFTFTAPPLDNTGWSIVDFSSQQSGGPGHAATNLIDGDLNTFWHTLTNFSTTNTVLYPQFITIDLGAPTNFNVVSLYNGHDDWVPAQIEILVAESDVNNMVSLGKYIHNPFTRDRQNYAVNLSTPVRYIKVVTTEPGPTASMPEWGTEFALLSELELYQED